MVDQGTSFEEGFKLTLIEFIGDYGAKIQNPWMTYGGYMLLANRLTEALKTNSLILTNSYWDALSNIMTTLLGLAWGERPSERQWLGVVLITIGIYLLQEK